MIKVGDVVLCEYNYKGIVKAYLSDNTVLVDVQDTIYKNRKPKKVTRRHMYNINSLKLI